MISNFTIKGNKIILKNTGEYFGAIHDFEYIEGKSFYDLNEIPTEAEIRNIIKQIAHIHSAKLESDFIYDKWTITNFIKENEKQPTNLYSS